MKTIFVFGSNKPGWHGAGAAKDALDEHGAIYGQGEGLQGNSYAVPTRDAAIVNGRLRIWTLPLSEVRQSVNRLRAVAKKYPNYRFECTAFGTGYAGFTHPEIAPMLKGAPKNIVVPKEWAPFCPDQPWKDWNDE